MSIYNDTYHSHSVRSGRAELSLISAIAGQTAPLHRPIGSIQITVRCESGSAEATMDLTPAQMREIGDQLFAMANRVETVLAPRAQALNLPAATEQAPPDGLYHEPEAA